jgi:hypothetical protein
MILATWNVLSLFRPEALAKLKKELKKYRVATAAVQEVTWCGNGIFDSGDFAICYSGNKKQIQFGTGFAIHKKYKSLIMDFNPVNERRCSLRMKGKFFNTTLICAHAPTEKDHEQKDTFYDKLERLYMKSPKHDIKIVLGDFNGKVGKEQDVTLIVGSLAFMKKQIIMDGGWWSLQLPGKWQLVAHYFNIKESTRRPGDRRMD